jgi:acetoin utilization deacetylase AcuC-like enzyme
VLRHHEVLQVRRLVTPVEQPERLIVLTASLVEDGHQDERPADHVLDPVLRVHAHDYVDFLERAFADWKKQPEAGPEVLPNTHPYLGVDRDGQPTGRAPARSISGQAAGT